MTAKADEPASAPCAADRWTATIARCRRGDEAAWAEVYHAFAPLVVRFLRRLLPGVRDLDDPVQQVFVAVFDGLDAFRGEARFSTWIYGIAVRVAGKAIRGEVRRRVGQAAYAGWLECLGSSVPDAAGGAEARALMRALGEVLDRLSFEHRTVWVMRELEGIDSDETAAALGIPAGTVRSRLFFARREIGEALISAGFGDTLPLPPARPVGLTRLRNEELPDDAL